MMLRIVIVLTFLFSLCSSVMAAGFDHSVWGRLLQTHVRPISEGKATEVDYGAILKERKLLQSYLQELSMVDKSVFDQWTKAEQLAFLINAYNSWTVELILSRYPDLESIKDLGSFLQSPWKKEFIPLLGETRSLDDIEHGLIRNSGRYNDPRIHFAVNCASIGCPALRPEPYHGDILERQLQDAETLFLSDESRNRGVDGVFEISSLFKWYGDDFRGWRGAESVEDYLLSRPALSGAVDDNNNEPQKNTLKIKYLTYDWQLNDISTER